MPTEKKKRFRRIRKALKIGAIGGLIMFGPTQLAYWANDIYHDVNPSRKRAAFKRQFGFPLKGWSEDIEGNKGNTLMIADIIERERREKGFELTSIRIRGRNYLKKPFLDQIAAITRNPNAGYCIFDWIVIDNSLSRRKIHHECKHAKFFDIMKEHPEFLEKWKALARDESGKSLYMTIAEQILAYTIGLDPVLDKNDRSENEKLGFVTDYSRLNVLEDTAEFGELAETDPQAFKKWIFNDGDGRNDLIAKRVALAQEYGIIPMGFTEFIRLDELFLDSSTIRGNIDLDMISPFMEASEEFLRKYPQSTYESQVRYQRAYVLFQGRAGRNPRNTVDDAIRECKSVLTSEYKDGIYYESALERLSEIYTGLDDTENSGIFRRARGEYIRRFLEGDVTLPRDGVNDFLASEGIDL